MNDKVREALEAVAKEYGDAADWVDAIGELQKMARAALASLRDTERAAVEPVVTGSATWRPAGHWQTRDGERLYTASETVERERKAYMIGREEESMLEAEVGRPHFYDEIEADAARRYPMPDQETGGEK